MYGYSDDYEGTKKMFEDLTNRYEQAKMLNEVDHALINLSSDKNGEMHYRMIECDKILNDLRRDLIFMGLILGCDVSAYSE